MSVRIITAALQVGILSIGSSLLASSDDLEEAPAAEVNNNRRGEIAEENFDQWVFQGVGNATAGRERINTRLKLQLDELDRICTLTDEQKKKLALAAKGDIKRFFDQVEQARAKFRAARRDQNNINQIFQDIQPLQARLSAGLFGEKSLFMKVVRTTLTEEQTAKYRVVEDERRQFRYRATVAVTLTTLEKSIPLKHSQRQSLMELLVQETRPPEYFGNYDYQFVMHQMSLLPEARIKPLLDDGQWKALKPQLNQGRAMEQMLIQQGVLDKENAGRAAPNADPDDQAWLDANRPNANRANANRAGAPGRERIQAAVEKLKDIPADATRPDNP